MKSLQSILAISTALVGKAINVEDRIVYFDFENQQLTTRSQFGYFEINQLPCQIPSGGYMLDDLVKLAKVLPPDSYGKVTISGCKIGKLKIDLQKSSQQEEPFAEYDLAESEKQNKYTIPVKEFTSRLSHAIDFLDKKKATSQLVIDGGIIYGCDYIRFFRASIVPVESDSETIDPMLKSMEGLKCNLNYEGAQTLLNFLESGLIEEDELTLTTTNAVIKIEAGDYKLILIQMREDVRLSAEKLDPFFSSDDHVVLDLDPLELKDIADKYMVLDSNKIPYIDINLADNIITNHDKSLTTDIESESNEFVRLNTKFVKQCCKNVTSNVKISLGSIQMLFDDPVSNIKSFVSIIQTN